MASSRANGRRPRSDSSFMGGLLWVEGSQSRAKRLAALHRPILRMAIDRGGAVTPVESLAVEFRWAAPNVAFFKYRRINSELRGATFYHSRQPGRFAHHVADG